MEINLGVFILIVVVGFISALGGYVLPILESRLTTALRAGRGETDPDKPEEKPTSKVDEHDILKVTIDPALKLHLELDGVRIEPESLSVEQRTRLVNVVIQIRPWIDGKTLPPVAAPTKAPNTAASDLAAASLVAATAVGTQPVATAPLRLDPLRGTRDLFLNDIVKKPEPPPPPSIVSMIDEVLQKKLETSPLAGKKIRLEEGSVGEVVVFVGATRYSGIDAVPDDDVKAIIREAIAEWDK